MKTFFKKPGILNACKIFCVCIILAPFTEILYVADKTNMYPYLVVS